MIAIAGGKGGCGKTTTTLATARALLATGGHARAVDLDAGMPNLHRMADVDRDPSLTDLVTTDHEATDYEATDQETQDDEVTHARILQDSHGVEIVPAPRALEDVDVPTVLDAIRPADGVALLDCPAGAGPAATAPLREADAAIVVTTDRQESTEDAAKTVRMARTLGVPVLGAIVTRTERVPTAVRTTLAIDRAIAVPHSGDPLEDDRVQDRYRRVAEAIRSWRDRRRTTSSKAVQSGTAPQNRSEPAGSRRSESACPHCGSVRSDRSRGPSSGRRDRRSSR